MKPNSGEMCYWRIKGTHEWRFGYCYHLSDPDLVRMGHWNGDTAGGVILSVDEIETRPYSK